MRVRIMCIIVVMTENLVFDAYSSCLQKLCNVCKMHACTYNTYNCNNDCEFGTYGVFYRNSTTYAKIYVYNYSTQCT